MSRYSQLADTEAGQRHLAGVAQVAIERARAGTNTACVDCGGEPAGGGLRCLHCFLAVSRPLKKGGHGTAAGYTKHRRLGQRPCRACREGHSAAHARGEAA